MKSITVYCSSSTNLNDEFHAPALTVGTELARRGVTLVYGGGCVGLMGEISRAARGNGGRVVGIITRRLFDDERADQACDELIVVDTMRERKQLLADRGDGFLVLPGGVGTYEEFFEILVGRQLGEHAKPIGVVNSHGYYNPLIAMIEHGIERRFISDAIKEQFYIHPEPLTVIDWLLVRQ
ncbi:MAG: TIGR00730 family Rossman fold protein [Phycisphaerales bacterium]|nr:TIGR00730 family Rossman fold protein [Phycisphaerales bacterium]MCI0675080.1 TIGR00730 family Rossman fold protein [Phycisphaerales bacterium]